jgi:hypothetical protein
LRTQLRNAYKSYERTELIESEINAIIDIDIIPFPNYEYCFDAFHAKVQQVREGLSKQICSSDFPGETAGEIAEAFKSIWDAVLENEELNLPDIRSLLTNFKYIQIKDQIIAQMRTQARELGNEEPCLSSEDFSQILQELSEKCYADFAELTQNLPPDINVTQLVSQNLNEIIKENTELKEKTLEANSQRCFRLVHTLIEEMKTEAAKLDCFYVKELALELKQLEYDLQLKFTKETTKFASSNTYESVLLDELTAIKETHISQKKTGWIVGVAVLGGTVAAIASAITIAPIAGTILAGEALFGGATATALGASVPAFLTKLIHELIPNRSSINDLLNTPDKLDEFTSEMFTQITSGSLRNIPMQDFKSIMREHANKYGFTCPNDKELSRVFANLGKLDVDREQFKVFFERLLRMALA